MAVSFGVSRDRATGLPGFDPQFDAEERFYRSSVTPRNPDPAAGVI